MGVFPGYIEDIQNDYKRLEYSKNILYQTELDFNELTTTIVPMLNEENCIGDFVESYKEGNLIIVDNGSEDKSVNTNFN